MSELTLRAHCSCQANCVQAYQETFRDTGGLQLSCQVSRDSPRILCLVPCPVQKVILSRKK